MVIVGNEVGGAVCDGFWASKVPGKIVSLFFAWPGAAAPKFRTINSKETKGQRDINLRIIHLVSWHDAREDFASN